MRGLHAGVFGYAGQQSTPRTPKIKGMAVTPPCGHESAMDKENVDVTSQSKDKENSRSDLRVKCKFLPKGLRLNSTSTQPPLSLRSSFESILNVTVFSVYIVLLFRSVSDTGTCYISL